jgi:preprotein translocase subunit SecE
MNTKAEPVGQGTSAGDILKYLAALLVAAGGIAVFYLLPQWPTPVRGLIVAIGFAAALGVLSLTALGHRGKDFVSESLFELRKVVWPTPVEARRITAVVLVVVVVISLILALFDWIIAAAIKWLLSH